MAKLGSYFALCPLINIRNLLGVVEDVNPNHVIVTLGKNISIVYKVSDQKQIRSYRTKDKFSSAVFYEPEEKKYAAVFNETYIRLWEEEEENIDKQKKYKLSKSIFTITKCGSTIFVIFNNGNVLPLSEVIKNRKTIDIEDVIDTNREYIVDYFQTIVENEVHIGQLIANKENEEKYFIWSVYGGEKKQDINKINIANRKNVNLVGYCFEKARDKFNLNLLTLWSDNKLYSYPIYEEARLNEKTTINPPGNLTAVIESLSCSNFVTMIPLNEDYIAMYGANKSEEGAILNIYNLQFKVTQTKQAFKMFTNGARLWEISNNLFLGVGQNLAVIPFRLESEQLAALIGSHKIKLSEDLSVVQTMQTVNWGEDTSKNTNKVSEKLMKLIKEMLEQGSSLNLICEELIDKLIDEENLDLIGDLIIYFNKMSESCIIKILKFLLTVNENKFKPDRDSHVLPEKMRPFQRCRFIDSLLLLPFTDMFLTKAIRSQLDLNESLLLLKYVTYMLQENSHSLPIDNQIDAEQKLIDWGNILLDANYVKLLLIKDDSVISVLNTFLTLVKEHLEGLEQVRQALPIVTAFKEGKYNKLQNINLPYSVDTIKLY